MAEVRFEESYSVALRAARVRAAGAVASARAGWSEREDLEQDTLLEIWRALAHYDPTRASLRTFIERVAETRFRSLLRARRRQPVIEPLDRINPASAVGIPAVALRVDLERLLSLLPSRDRELLVLLMEHPPSEAARRLGIGRSTVYGRLARLRPVFSAAGYGPLAPRGGKR